MNILQSQLGVRVLQRILSSNTSLLMIQWPFPEGDSLGEVTSTIGDASYMRQMLLRISGSRVNTLGGLTGLTERLRRPLLDGCSC